MSQLEPRTEGSRPLWTAVSVSLFVIGLLILVPSGLCTALFGFLTLVESFGQDVDLSMILMILIFGGVPMAVGGVLVWAGLKARRRD